MSHSQGVTRPNKELFGTFGPRSTFERYRQPSAFDRVVEGPTVTVGIRDPALGMYGRSAAVQAEDGVCVIWGEVYLRNDDDADPAAWLLDAFGRRGTDALSGLNGSFLAVVDHVDREAVVGTDPVRSWECYYADAPAARCFGTDAATIARTIPSPSVAPEPLDEFLSLGFVFENRTTLDGLSRVPFDGYLTATSTGTLERFVYEPREFDYVGELAARLERALERRACLPGRKGMLLSAGYDSRAVLAGISDIESAFTLGRQNEAEVAVSETLAEQYDTSHTTLVPDRSYLNTDLADIQYGYGTMESLHAHHASYVDRMDVTTIYHGAMADSLLHGHFLPMDAVELFELKCPPYRLSRDPDVVDNLIETFGFLPECRHLAATDGRYEESREALVRRRISELYDDWGDRFETPYNGMALIGIQNQPTRPFRYHLADHFVESCVMLDAELIEWHLSTPPEHRNTRTFLQALRKLDDGLLRHRPPDRPTDSFTINQITNFVRRKLPFVSAYEGPWPDRSALYEQTDLDRVNFGENPVVQKLPWRLKLRINDITTWLESATAHCPVHPDELVDGNRDERGIPGWLTG